MNGCWRSEKEIKENVCNCDKYDEAKCSCLSELDTVSKLDGQPMCPKNPNSIDKNQYIKLQEEKQRKNRNK